MCGAPIERAKSTPEPQQAQPFTPSNPSYSSRPSLGAPSYSSYKKKGEVDSHSRMALVFGLISCIMMFVGFVIGGIAMGTRHSFNYTGEYNTNPFIYVAIPLSLVFNIAGLVFGIVGRVQANKTSTVNDVEKWGRILSILGIVFNAIGIVLVVIVGPILIINSSYY